MVIENMKDFFTAWVDGYVGHMLNEVEGFMEGCVKMAQFLPYGIGELLDLGCGTGLGLDEIFKKQSIFMRRV